jgi:hypothetical protein
MSYSKIHRGFANWYGDEKILDTPQYFLGPNYETVLNFWWWIDSFNEEQQKMVAERYSQMCFHPRNEASKNAWFAARQNSLNEKVCDTLWDSIVSDKRITNPNAIETFKFVCGRATYELMGMHILFEQGKKLTFVPMFDGI